MKHTSAHSQHGGAALIVTLLLFLAMALAAFALNRHLVFEQRSAANQARATQAFEAAEAGLEWAQAQLNSTQRIGADCRPSTDAAASSFRAASIRPSRAAYSSGVMPPGVSGFGILDRASRCERFPRRAILRRPRVAVPLESCRCACVR